MMQSRVTRSSPPDLATPEDDDDSTAVEHASSVQPEVDPPLDLDAETESSSPIWMIGVCIGLLIYLGFYWQSIADISERGRQFPAALIVGCAVLIILLLGRMAISAARARAARRTTAIASSSRSPREADDAAQPPKSTKLTPTRLGTMFASSPWTMALLTLVYVAALSRFDYAVPTVAFMAATVAIHSRQKRLQAAGMAVAVSLAIVLIFTTISGLRVPGQ